jgi:dipeptidase
VYTIGTNINNNEQSAFWAFNRVEKLVDKHYKDRIFDVQENWVQFESQELADQASVEAYALQLYNGGDVAGARQYLTDYSNNLAMAAFDTAHRLRDEILSQGTANTPTPLSVAPTPTPTPTYPLFSDDFEIGNTSAWSAVKP